MIARCWGSPLGSGAAQGISSATTTFTGATNVTGTPLTGCPEPPSLSFSRTGAGTAPEHTPQWLIWGRRDLDTRRLGHRDAAPVTPTWLRVGAHQGHAIGAERKPISPA